MFVPVVVFTYNRKDHTEKILTALSNCEEIKDTEVYVYSDAPQNEKAVEAVNEVREFLDGFNKIPHMTIIKQPVNKGCNASIKDGITEMIKKQGKIIVVEDDIYVCNSFLKYMNAALNYYEENPQVFSVTGYNPVSGVSNNSFDTFLGERYSCWGWGTWQSRWEKVNWNDVETAKNIDSKRFKMNSLDLYNTFLASKKGNNCKITWDVLVYYYMFSCNMRTVYPIKSHSDNIGLDGSGERSSNDTKYVNSNFNVDYLSNGYNFSDTELTKSSYSKFMKKYVNYSFSSRVKNVCRRISQITHTEKLAYEVKKKLKI